MALSARQKADVLIRKILSPPDPLKPGKTIVEEPLVDLASGQLLRPIPERLQPIKRSGGWWCAVDTDPALDPDASWEDYELFEQKIYVNHPLVFHNDLLKQDRPKCHKCNSKHGKALLIHGWRPGSHPVLTPDGQFCVLSFGLKCPSCPSHKNKGIVSDRFARHNYQVKCQMALAHQQVQPTIIQQQKQQEQAQAAASRSKKQQILSPPPPMPASAEGRNIKQHLAGFDHCLDFEQMHAVNQLLLGLGCDSLFPLLDSVALAAVMSSSSADAALYTNVPETAPPGTEGFAELLENWGDWDEGVLQEGVVGQQPQQQQQQQQQQPSAAADGADGADAPDSAAGAADSAAANAAAAVVESGAVAAADAAAAAVDDDEFYEAAAAEYHAAAAAPASPYGSSKRRASAGVAAAVEACMVVDSDSEEEQPRKRRRISQLSHAAAVAAVAAAEDTGLQPAGADFTQHQQAAAAIAAAAAAARKGGSTGRIRSTSGGSPSSKHVRVRPGFVESRVPRGRRLHYRDFIGPVHTEDEQQLFQRLLEQHCSSSRTGGVRDWAAFTRDWNLEAFSNLSSGGKAVLTFKQVSHLKDYDKSLARTAGQLAGAAMAASSGQEQQQQQQQQQQQPELLPQMSDMAAALKSIISECVQDLCQPSGSSPAELHLQLPDILRDLLTQVAGHSSPDVPGDAAQQHDLAEDAARPAAPAAAAAAAGGAAGAAAQASPAMPSAGVTAAAALAAGAVAAAAAAGCAAGQAPAAAAQHAFSKMMASGRSAGGGATQRVSKKTGRPTVPGAGKGKGAAGGSKVCVPCTLRKHSLHYAEEARTHADAVFNDKWHQPTSSTPCPYCKCKVCKRSWDHSRRIDNYNFPLKADCPHGN